MRLLAKLFLVMAAVPLLADQSHAFGRPTPTPKSYNVAVETFTESVSNENRARASVTLAGRTIQSDDTGYASFGSIRAGNYTVVIEAEGYERLETQVDIRDHRDQHFPSETRPSLRYALTPRGPWGVAVEVFNGDVANNRRVSGALVQINSDSRTSDGSGFTHFEVRSGRKTIRVEAPGFGHFETTVDITGHRDQVYPSDVSPSIRVQLERTHSRREGRVSISNYALRDSGGEFSGLGATLFWATWGFRHDRQALERDLAYLSQNGFDYIRVLGTVGWADKPADSRWPDYNDVIAGLTDLAYDVYGLRIEWTLIGGAPWTETKDQRVDLIHRFLSMSQGREHKIMHFEIANEAWQNGFGGDGGISQLRELTRYMKDRTDILVAASAPSGTDDCEKITELYRDGIADFATVHFSRETRTVDGMWRPVRQPWGYSHCPGSPKIGSNNEPIGPGSSVADDKDPVRLATSAIVTFISKMPFYVFHSRRGVGIGQNFGLHSGQPMSEMPGSDAFATMKSYLPADLPNWQNHNFYWAGNPFTVYSDGKADAVWPDENRADGVVRNFASTKGNEFIALPMGIRNFVRMSARRAMSFDVIHPVTGQVLESKHLNAGDAFELRGLESFVLKGVFR